MMTCDFCNGMSVKGAFSFYGYGDYDILLEIYPSTYRRNMIAYVYIDIQSPMRGGFCDTILCRIKKKYGRLVFEMGKKSAMGTEYNQKKVHKMLEKIHLFDEKTLRRLLIYGEGI